MQYRFLGKSQIKASIIGLGTYTFGGGEDHTPSNDKDSINTIHAALDNGVTLIDTAPSYGWGHCERVVGDAIRGRRDKVVIATKCGVWWQDTRGSYNGIKDGKKNYISLHPDTIKIEVENSLKNLGTDYLDLLQCHKPAIPPVETPISETPLQRSIFPGTAGQDDGCDAPSSIFPAKYCGATTETGSTCWEIWPLDNSYLVNRN